MWQNKGSLQEQALAFTLLWSSGIKVPAKGFVIPKPFSLILSPTIAYPYGGE